MRINLKLLRVKHNLTQEQMAEETGITRCTYAAVENGALRGSETFWNTVQSRFGVPGSEMWELMRNET